MNLSLVFVTFLMMFRLLVDFTLSFLLEPFAPKVVIQHHIKSQAQIYFILNGAFSALLSNKFHFYLNNDCVFSG